MRSMMKKNIATTVSSYDDVQNLYHSRVVLNHVGLYCDEMFVGGREAVEKVAQHSAIESWMDTMYGDYREELRDIISHWPLDGDNETLQRLVLLLEDME